MSIIWKYLDKRSATIAAIKDYSSMKFIIDSTDTEIAKENEKLVSLGSPKFDGMPHSHNPQAAEDRIVKGIEEIDVLRERYRQAVEYMNWFVPAWKQLTEEEQYVLDAFYSDDYSAVSAVFCICDKYHIERSSAYNRKNKALTHLQVLLFGKD